MRISKYRVQNYRSILDRGWWHGSFWRTCSGGGRGGEVGGSRDDSALWTNTHQRRGLDG